MCCCKLCADLHNKCVLLRLWTRVAWREFRRCKSRGALRITCERRRCDWSSGREHVNSRRLTVWPFPLIVAPPRTDSPALSVKRSPRRTVVYRTRPVPPTALFVGSRRRWTTTHYTHRPAHDRTTVIANEWSSSGEASRSLKETSPHITDSIQVRRDESTLSLFPPRCWRVGIP